MSSSNCCFFTCIHVSQEAGQVVWYSHLFKNVPQFVVIHTVKGFGVVNEAKVDVFLEFSHFFNDPMDVGDLIYSSSAFSKSSFSVYAAAAAKSLQSCQTLCKPMDCYCTTGLILHTSRVMLRILQARLQQYLNQEPPGV